MIFLGLYNVHCTLVQLHDYALPETKWNKTNNTVYTNREWLNVDKREFIGLVTQKDYTTQLVLIT